MTQQTRNALDAANVETTAKECDDLLVSLRFCDDVQVMIRLRETTGSRYRTM